MKSAKKSRALIIKDGMVLVLLKYKNGAVYLTIPGGTYEETDATLEQTVLRELYEETSIQAKVVKFLFSAYDPLRKCEQSLYLCEYVSGEPELLDEVEIKHLKENPNLLVRPVWVIPSYFKNMEVHPEVLKDFFVSYLEQNS
ncbi:NUDIX domain-containing protein [Candidatus Nomurabacteria bacterium]|uniref:NUDIX domain-containing protein n=1 Tax=candidate division WWE3 bacterium TaxID=2053526 RepID=A0A955DZY9_UNCKA|nr:NUDIX domain-containing protein [candidate division WWE3 bacterium]MCB9823928.1 NUDIX domain-containing protein [Candidatus Nomurabacteria bacterium]MCB9827091.1 NUDIX domain-containing protein [Candidatus Nomurabacteria bacterium]MCB9827867.1 NUDIX domain-containing protein [Candidatus Nomurabacteria bacterium]HXK52990.1 NUDIX domain-containing protein [bacterium]